MEELLLFNKFFSDCHALVAKIQPDKVVSCCPDGEFLEELECEPMPNVLAALLNIGGAVCSTLQSFGHAHCWSTVQ